MSLRSLTPLLLTLFISYINRVTARESLSATPTSQSEEWKTLQATITALQEENEELKSENREVVGKLAVSQGALRSQISSLKEANVAQQGDLNSLRAELVEATAQHGRLTVDSSKERVALQIRVADLEVGELI